MQVLEITSKNNRQYIECLYGCAKKEDIQVMEATAFDDPDKMTAMHYERVYLPYWSLGKVVNEGWLTDRS